MQEFTTQFIVKNKSEAMDGNDVLSYTMYINPTQEGVTGELRVNVSDAAVNDFFNTGELFDVTITPHTEQS